MKVGQSVTMMSGSTTHKISKGRNTSLYRMSEFELSAK